MHPFEIIRRPIVTEKSSVLQERGKYVFEVSIAANKAQIREAIEKAFNVDVVAINTINKKGKRKRFGPKLVENKGLRKAIVTLKSGDKIEVFEGA
ncbi:MAG: 50S ribosomal protein L23 [Chloroflexi bacterium]|nr:50S ribosomal protein L23 [Chloroflexota bacterium]